MIAIIDYGAGNIHSIEKALEFVGAQVRVTDDPAVLKDAEAIADEDAQRLARSAGLLKEWTAQVNLAKSHDALKQIGKLITPELKSQMIPTDVQALREAYQLREKELPQASKAA